MRTPILISWQGRAAALLGVMLVSGCSLLPKETTPLSVYSLDGLPNTGPTAPTTPALTLLGPAPTLVVNPTRGAPGFDSQHIVYVRTAHQLEHFAHSEWVDTPARMLEPRIVAAVAAAGSFRGVALATSGMAGDMRLDTEVLRLQQEFGAGPSRVRFTLRAALLNNTTRQVISWREFDEHAVAESDDPYGGVVAANRVVQRVMDQLSRYCAVAAERWLAPASPAPKPRDANLPAR